MGSDVHTEIERINAEFEDAFARGDVDAAASCYTTDAIHMSNAPRWCTRKKGVRDSLAEVAQLGAKSGSSASRWRRLKSRSSETPPLSGPASKPGPTRGASTMAASWVMDHTALAHTVAEDLLDGADQAWRTVGDHQQRGAQPVGHQPAQEVGMSTRFGPTVTGLESAPSHRGHFMLSHPREATTASWLSAETVSSPTKWLASRYRHSRSTSARRRCRRVSNSVLMASHTPKTLDVDSTASAPSASASDAYTSRVDRPRT